MSPECGIQAPTPKRERFMLFGALLVLAMGVAVYVLDRAPASVYFLPPGWSLANGHRYFGALGGHLPDFVHVYAFGLLTALVLGASCRPALVSCIAWWAIDSLFEIGQHPAISPHIVAVTPPWFAGTPFLENTAAYFLRGSFDPWDLVAIVVGAVAAYGTIALSRWEGPSHALH